MACKFTQLQCKEVVCLSDGRRLGYIRDVCIELPAGTIASVIVPVACRFWNLWGRQEDYIIPFSAIRRIGPDIVLVDIKPESCRCARPRLPFGLFP